MDGSNERNEYAKTGNSVKTDISNMTKDDAEAISCITTRDIIMEMKCKTILKVIYFTQKLLGVILS